MISRDDIVILTAAAKQKALSREEALAAIEARVDAAIQSAAESGDNLIQISWEASKDELIREVAMKYLYYGYLPSAYRMPSFDNEDRIMMEIKW